MPEELGYILGYGYATLVGALAIYPIMQLMWAILRAQANVSVGKFNNKKHKIDPALDLSGHFRETESLPVPFDPVNLFGRVAPLEVEVGSGKGLRGEKTHDARRWR